MIYGIYFLLVLFGSYYYDFSNRTRNQSLYFYLLLLLISLIVGLRYYVGGDTITYEMMYSSYPTIDEFSFNHFGKYRFESGWVIFMSFCRTFSSSFVLPQLIIAFFFNFTLFRFIKGNTKYPFVAIFIYFVSMNFTGLNFEFLRQAVAVTIFYYGITYFNNKEYFKYYIVVFLATTFHISALITLFIPFINIIRLKPKRLLSTIAMILIVIVVLKINFNQVLTVLQSFIFGGGSLMGIIAYAEDAASISYNVNYYIFRLSSSVLLPIIIIYLSRIISNKRINLFNYRLLIVYFIFSLMSILHSEFFRLLLYLYPVILIVIADSVGNILHRFKQKIILLILIVFIINISSFYYWFDPSAEITTYKRYMPYKTYFSKEKTPERREIERRRYKILNLNIAN